MPSWLFKLKEICGYFLMLLFFFAHSILISVFKRQPKYESFGSLPQGSKPAAFREDGVCLPSFLSCSLAAVRPSHAQCLVLLGEEE